MNQQDPVKIFGPLGQTENNYVIHDPKPNRVGLIAVRNTVTGHIIKVHRKRIMDPQQTNIDTTQDNLPTDAQNGLETDEVRTNVQKPNAQDKNVDYNALNEVAELWVKEGIDFPTNGMQVRSCCMIFGQQEKYVFFNTYNDTYGSKGNKPKIDEILAGQEVGYKLSNVDKLRRKLTQKKYIRFNGAISNVDDQSIQ